MVFFQIFSFLGKYYFFDGRVYDGQWKDNRKNGKGKLTMPEGVFEGDFTDGHMEGKGTLRWNDGRVFTGSWFKGRQHGQGEFTEIDGTTREGIWQDGHRIKWVNYGR